MRIRASDWLTVRPKVVQVRQGQHVTLECDVTGAKPAAGVTWQKNGVDVTPGEGTEQEQSGHRAGSEQAREYMDRAYD